MKTRYIEGYVKLYINTYIKEDEDPKKALLDEAINMTEDIYECLDPEDTTIVEVVYAGPLREEK